ncbi:MAG: hypothetical protein OXO54_12490 [Chloroflexota bacterium]|nr:hypothetical protein [Chloroflexota bacterium]MDE2899129.1 hypothetical protein [Chloroflexota bacterium]
MGARAYILVVAVCAIWLAARAATQPIGFDFDEPAHLGTIAEIREFGGLAPADRFPEIIVNPRTVEPRFHMFPPLPYLAVAGVTAAAQTDPTAAGVLGIGRAFSALMALLAVVSAGLAVRNLQEPGSTWNVPAIVSLGLALTPGLHSMGASVTASTWALAAVGLICAATTWAVRRQWSLGATVAVVAVAAFAVAARASAYPVLILIPLAMLASRLPLRAAVARLAAVVVVVVLANGWWMVRNALVTGDLLGADVYLSTVADVAACNIARESQEWCREATGPWPAWTLLTSTDIAWVFLSRMLVRRTWIDSLTIALWIGMVVLPSVAVLIHRVRRGITRPLTSFPLLMAAVGIGTALLAFALAVNLSAQMGWSIYARDAFIALIPLVVAVAYLADLRHDRLRTLCFGSGLAFAAAANAGFMLAVLP